MDDSYSTAYRFPFDHLRKAVEDKRRRTKAKREDPVIVVLTLPAHAKQVMVFRANWAETECASYIQFGHESSPP